MENYFKSKTYKIIDKDIKNAMLSHSYILQGLSEDELHSFSKNIAKQILCKSDGQKPCNKCSVCNNIENEIFSDVIIYPKNTKTINTADSNQIVLDSYVRPLESEYKFFILNNFENATNSAQNKLLKTVEEPSKNVIFIINTTNIFGVLDTIKSRSKIIFETSDEQSSYDVLSSETLQSLTLMAMYEMQRSTEVLKTAFEIQELEKDLEKFVEFFQSFILDIVKIKSGLGVNNLLNKNKVYAIEELAEQLSFEGLEQIMIYSNKLVEELQANCNKSLALENFLLKILEIKYLCKINSL